MSAGDARGTQGIGGGDEGAAGSGASCPAGDGTGKGISTRSVSETCFPRHEVIGLPDCNWSWSWLKK